MKINFFFALLLCLVISSAVSGQTLSEALRLSQIERQGTARFMATGGSMGALGADFGAIGVNPAGLANFRRSEFLLSLGTQVVNASTLLQDGQLGPYDTKESSVSIPGFSMIFTKQPIASDWRQVNFSIGIHRLADFNRNFFFSDRSRGSITQRFIELGEGLPPENLDAFEAGPAYDAFVTFYDTIQNNYGADVGPEDIIAKEQEIFTTGSINELNISVAGNLQDRLLLGVSVGIPFLNYTEEKFYIETNEAPSSIFNSLAFNEFVDATGTGFNFTAGAIFKATPEVSVSASIQSPTWYRINENFDTEIRYDYDFIPGIFPAPGPQEALSPFGEFDYNISTPWRFNGGIGAIIARSGFISAGIELVDYSSASFNFSRNNSFEDFEREERALNQEVASQLDNAINFNIGGEWAAGKFRLRGGYGMDQIPFVNDSDFIQSYSAGLGFRGNQFYFDLAYRYRDDQNNYALYVLQNPNATPIVESAMQNHRVTVTFGFKL